MSREAYMRLEDPDFAEPLVAKPHSFAGPIVQDRRAQEELALVLGWVLVGLINMFVPVCFGLLITEKDGRHGMLLGIAAVLGCGVLSYAGRVGREALRTVIYGAWVVAVPPIGPFLQFKAGQIGLGVAETRGGRSSLIVETLHGGLIATLVTAGLIIAPAGALGIIGRGVSYLLRCACDESDPGD